MQVTIKHFTGVYIMQNTMRGDGWPVKGLFLDDKIEIITHLCSPEEKKKLKDGV